MNLSIQTTPTFPTDEPLDQIVSRYIDEILIDSYETSFELGTGALLAAFSAEFLGTCHVRRAVVGNVEDDLRTMASLAADVFERKSTECGSHGVYSEASRPVFVPEGFTFQYVECCH